MSCAHTRDSEGSLTPDATQKNVLSHPKRNENRLLLHRTDWDEEMNLLKLLKLFLLMEEGKIESINSALCWIKELQGNVMSENILLILSTEIVLKFTF